LRACREATHAHYSQSKQRWKLLASFSDSAKPQRALFLHSIPKATRVSTSHLPTS